MRILANTLRKSKKRSVGIRAALQQLVKLQVSATVGLIAQNGSETASHQPPMPNDPKQCLSGIRVFANEIGFYIQNFREKSFSIFGCKNKQISVYFFSPNSNTPLIKASGAPVSGNV
jgi:hypothetical protein